jgi:hypothetical protein
MGSTYDREPQLRARGVAATELARGVLRGIVERGFGKSCGVFLPCHTSIRVTERHYNPWVRSRQERLEAELIDKRLEARSGPRSENYRYKFGTLGEGAG